MLPPEGRKDRKFSHGVIGFMPDCRIWVEHCKADHLVIITDKIGFSCSIRKIGIKISIVVIALFIHFIGII